jgi:hypothetical protein
MALLHLSTFVLALSSVTNGFPQSRPFKHALNARQDSGQDPLTVDLGYGMYQGYANASTNITTWKGCAAFQSFHGYN